MICAHIYLYVTMCVCVCVNVWLNQFCVLTSLMLLLLSHGGKHLRLMSVRGASKSDDTQLLRVQAMKSSLKTGVAYTVTLLFDSDEMIDSHCACSSGKRAFPCAHVAATLLALSYCQGASPSTRGDASMEEFARAVKYPMQDIDWHVPPETRFYVLCYLFFICK